MILTTVLSLTISINIMKLNNKICHYDYTGFKYLLYYIMGYKNN